MLKYSNFWIWAVILKSNLECIVKIAVIIQFLLYKIQIILNKLILINWVEHRVLIFNISHKF